MPPKAIRRLESELERLAGAPVTLDRPSRAEHGDYATNVALQQAPRDGKPPRELAESLAREAAGLPEVERAEVAGPGFVNLFLAPAWYGDALAEMLAAQDSYGGASALEWAGREPRVKAAVALGAFSSLRDCVRDLPILSTLSNSAALASKAPRRRTIASISWPMPDHAATRSAVG